jgi:hypothetical protein
MDLMTLVRPRGRAMRMATILLIGASLPVCAQNKKDAASSEKKAKAPLDSAKVAENKLEAESLPLFRKQDVVAFTLIADFKTVNKDRDTLSTKEYPATLIIADTAGAERKIPVKLRTRGHYRLAARNCAFVPLRINFAKKEMKGTVFEGFDKIKLGTHCQANNDYNQYVLREHAAYRVHNTLSPRSYRTRLAKVTYQDSTSNKPPETHNGLLFENEEDVAKRLEGEVVELRRALFDDVDPQQINEVSIFEYFIGNTDWSLYALHNIRLVRKLDGTLLPLAYDLDFSGLVGTRYATPDYRLSIRNVKQRLYRGPCRTVEDLEPALAPYRAKEAEVLAVYDSIPGLDPRYVKEAQGYLKEFFSLVKKPRDVKGTFVDACEGKPSV